VPAQKKYTRRADGRYYTKVSAGSDPSGRPIRVNVYGRSVAELERNIDAVKADVINGTFVIDKDVTFAEYAEKWYQVYIDGSDLSHNRKCLYKNTLKNHVSCLLPLKMCKITRTNVQQGYNALSGHPDLQREYKMAVNQIFRAAIEDGICVRNPAENIATAPARKKKRRALTEMERNAIRKADLTDKERCFIYLLWYAGLRRQEILALTRGDISGDSITVNKAVEFRGNQSDLKETKSAAGERVIPVLDPLRPVLASYLPLCEGFYLFPDKSGAIMSKTAYRRFFEQIRRKINDAAGGRGHSVKTVVSGKPRHTYVYDLDVIQGLTAHTFRHEFATILYYSGVDLLDAVRIFGHADSRTLTDIYAELRQAESGSVKKLNQYLARYAGTKQ